MITRNQFLLVLGEDASAWAARFGIEPYEHPCDVCGAPMRTTIPCASGELRGLIAPVCECGNVDVPYCVVRDPKRGDLFTGGEGR